MKKYFVALALVTIPTVALLVLILEVFFRVGIPASELPYARSSPSDSLLCYDPTLASDGVFTMGPLAEVRGRWHINNAGWNSGLDYHESVRGGRDSVGGQVSAGGQDSAGGQVSAGGQNSMGGRISESVPLIAFVGGSYVEAFQVNLEESFVSLVRESLRNRTIVYGFGFSGSPMSQYLHMARRIDKRYHADRFIFVMGWENVVGSLQNSSGQSLYSLYNISAVGSVIETTPNLYRPDWRNRFLRKSALVRYLKINLRLDAIRFPFHRKKSESAPYVEKVPESGDLARIAAAINYFTRSVAAEYPGSMVVYDADRRAIYRTGSVSPGDLADSDKQARILKLLKQSCEASGIDFLDLTPAFRDDYRSRGERFNPDVDYHWNRLGNRIVAQAILQRWNETP